MHNYNGEDDQNLKKFNLCNVFQSLESVIESGFSCLSSQSPDDTYTIMLMAYANSMRGDPGKDKLEEIMEILDERKIQEGLF